MKLQCVENYDAFLFEKTPDHMISKGYATPNFQIRTYTRMTEDEFLSIKDQPDFLKLVQPKPQLGADHQPFRMRVMVRPLNHPAIRVKFQMETRRMQYEFVGEVEEEVSRMLARELKEIEIIINQNWDAFVDYANDKALYAIYDQK